MKVLKHWIAAPIAAAPLFFASLVFAAARTGAARTLASFTEEIPRCRVRPTVETSGWVDLPPEAVAAFAARFAPEILRTLPASQEHAALPLAADLRILTCTSADEEALPDGSFVVLDRATQRPLAAGHSLEGRIEGEILFYSSDGGRRSLKPSPDTELAAPHSLTHSYIDLRIRVPELPLQPARSDDDEEIVF